MFSLPLPSSFVATVLAHTYPGVGVVRVFDLADDAYIQQVEQSSTEEAGRSPTTSSFSSSSLPGTTARRTLASPVKVGDAWHEGIEGGLRVLPDGDHAILPAVASQMWRQIPSRTITKNRTSAKKRVKR